MKGKRWMMIPAVFILAALLIFSAQAETAKEEEPAEWTVMIYLCGSDLESIYEYATGNLEEMMLCDRYGKNYQAYHDGDQQEFTVPEVNVVLETGGCRTWHAQRVDMDIAADRLQRWRYQLAGLSDEMGENTFELEEELPSASMADPETLADFIRWGAEKYPAKKYALVLWDHGGGSKTGLFYDELYSGDILYLDELQHALADGGVNFEAVLFDACMMANIETAWAIHDNAKWMIGSEELVSGQGTAIGKWLQQLYYTPQWDGKRLGRWICEMTHRKYSDEDNEEALSTLTWSVIDLSEIERVVGCFDDFFRVLGQCYQNDIEQLTYLTSHFTYAYEFGLGDSRMVDLTGLVNQKGIPETYGYDQYADMLDALENAIVYSVHGDDRDAAYGLSFCFVPDLEPDEMENYARNCPSASYLALMDAIMPEWTAPDWVYERVERLPGIEGNPAYHFAIEKVIDPDGAPGITLPFDEWIMVWSIYAEVYQVSEKSGEIIRLGCTQAPLHVIEEGLVIYELSEFGSWPAIDGEFCEMEIVKRQAAKESYYNIPVQINGIESILRCVNNQHEENPLSISGIWQGYNPENGVFSRNIMPLTKAAGRDYCLLHRIEKPGDSGAVRYETGRVMTMPRVLDIQMAPMKQGTYILNYCAEDIFMRVSDIGSVQFYWDGEKAHVPEGTWEGTVTMGKAAEQLPGEGQ